MGGKESKEGSSKSDKKGKDRRKSAWKDEEADKQQDRRQSRDSKKSTATNNNKQQQQQRRTGDDFIKRIVVFRNGDQFDRGTIITVNRREVKNWITFLDMVTKKTKIKEGAVHHIFTMAGEEVRVFGELEDQEEYVASHTIRFRDIDYGSFDAQNWNRNNHISTSEPTFLESTESKHIYLYTRDYRPTLGDVWEDESFDLRKGRSGQSREDQNRGQQQQNQQNQQDDKRRNSKGDKNKKKR